MDKKLTKPEEQLSRFLYRYMTLQDNIPFRSLNIFLPSIKSIGIGYLRDILPDKKSHLKKNEVNHMQVPLFQEISVKNLYADAMTDPALAKYFQDPDQLSDKLLQHDFFFGKGAEKQKDDGNLMGPGGADKRKKIGPGLSVHPIQGGLGKMQIESSDPK